jgi:MFS family permease
VILLFARDLWMFYIFAIVFGIGYGGMAAGNAPLAVELFGITSVGIVLGSITFVTHCAGIGSIIAGRIYDVTGSYQWAFIMSIALAVLGLALVLLLKPTNKGDNE